MWVLKYLHPPRVRHPWWAEQLNMFGTMVQDIQWVMQCQAPLLHNIIAQLPASTVECPGPQTPARHHPASAPQRQYCSHPPQYRHHTDKFDSFHLAASSSFLQQLEWLELLMNSTLPVPSHCCCCTFVFICMVTCTLHYPYFVFLHDLKVFMLLSFMGHFYLIP